MVGIIHSLVRLELPGSLMFRTLVTALVSVQLLMPPSMCICQAAPLRSAFASTSAPGPRMQVVSVDSGIHRASCQCESCRTQAERPDGDDPLNSEGAPSPSSPGKHAPGCPAALGDMPNKLLAPSAEVPTDVAQAFCDLLPPVSFLIPVASLRDRPNDIATSPPLFISHCALLI